MEFWHVGFHRNGSSGLRVLTGREHAIEVACGILERGGEIFHLGPPDRPREIGAEEIRRIHLQRKHRA